MSFQIGCMISFFTDGSQILLLPACFEGKEEAHGLVVADFVVWCDNFFFLYLNVKTARSDDQKSHHRAHCRLTYRGAIYDQVLFSINWVINAILMLPLERSSKDFYRQLY